MTGGADHGAIATAEQVLTACRASGLRLATVESCTGGLVAGALTAIPGSSDVIECGFVTYSNQSKTRLVGVPADLIERRGAVSEDVARAMAEGALSVTGADIAIAITGIAGPGGGTADKPVGLVHFACARSGWKTASERHVFPGDRAAVRDAAARTALSLLLRQAG